MDLFTREQRIKSEAPLDTYPPNGTCQWQRTNDARILTTMGFYNPLNAPGLTTISSYRTPSFGFFLSPTSCT
jgi:hypothetical protein